jgi:hypothetical protein
MSIPVAPIVTRNAVLELAHSALPGAPVVPSSRRPRPIRSALARGLRVTADALAAESRR